MSQVAVRNPEPSDETAETVGRWLRESVAPVYDAMVADPSRAVSANDVIATLRELHLRRSVGDELEA